MADLTTLAKVKRHLFGSDAPSDADTLLAALITSSSAWMESQLGQAVLTRTVTETRNGNGGTHLRLKAYPVTAITSVTVDGTAIAARSSVTGSGYVLLDDAIDLVGYTFTAGYSNVVVVYTAGAATTPTDIEQAVIEHVGIKYRDRQRIGLTSDSQGGESATFSNAGSLAYIQGVIEASPYRVWAVS